MTSKKKRAFHFGGASWLLLCAMADGAMAQDAAAPSASTQLPEITVTAPSPIVRRKPVVPSRTPARVARAAPGQNRERAPQSRKPRRSRAAPQQGVLPVVTDQFATVTVVPNEEIRRSRQRHSLAISCSQSPALPAPASRPAPPAGRSSGASTSTASASSRTAPTAAAPPISARIISCRSIHWRPTRSKSSADRRRCATARPRSAASSARPTIASRMPCPPARRRRSRATGCRRRRRWRMRNQRPASPSRPERPSVRSIAASKAASCSMPAAAISRSMPTPMAARPATTAFPSYPYLFDQTRPVNGRQPNSAAQADGASIGGSYIFQGGFIGAAITQNDTLYRIPGIDGADHQTRIDAHQTKFTAKGEYRPDAAAIDAVRFWAGATDYKHNEIGLADPADPRSSACGRPSPTRSRKAASRCRWRRSTRALPPSPPRSACRPGHQELTAPSPDDPTSPLNGLWDPEQEHQGRRLRLQRVQVHRNHQGADRRPHRACQSQRNDAGVHSGAVRPQRQSRRYRSAGRRAT